MELHRGRGVALTHCRIPRSCPSSLCLAAKATAGTAYVSRYSSWYDLRRPYTEFQVEPDGDKLSAGAENPASIDGNMVIPNSSTATATVVEAKAKGKVKGEAR
jgi:hypothetical protein